MATAEQRKYPFVVAAAPNGDLPVVGVNVWKRATKTRCAAIAKTSVLSPVGVPVVETWLVYKQDESPESPLFPDVAKIVQTMKAKHPLTKVDITVCRPVPKEASVAGSYQQLDQAVRIAAELNAKPTGFRFDAESAERFAVESADGDAPQDFKQLGLFDV